MSYLSPEEREVDRLEEELTELDQKGEEAREIRQQLSDIARYQREREEWENRGIEEGWL